MVFPCSWGQAPLRRLNWGAVGLCVGFPELPSQPFHGLKEWEVGENWDSHVRTLGSSTLRRQWTLETPPRFPLPSLNRVTEDEAQPEWERDFPEAKWASVLLQRDFPFSSARVALRQMSPIPARRGAFPKPAVRSGSGHCSLGTCSGGSTGQGWGSGWADPGKTSATPAELAGLRSRRRRLCGLSSV